MIGTTHSELSTTPRTVEHQAIEKKKK